jgi:hypothetical protein
MAKQRDNAGRPLITTGDYSVPTNLYGQGSLRQELGPCQKK